MLFCVMHSSTRTTPVPESHAWQTLRVRLDRCAEVGRIVSFWLRDDDAVEPSEALDRLCSLSGRHTVPLLLAIIPKHAGSAIRDYLAEQVHVRPAQHGFSHRNHAPAPERAQELGLHRPLEAVLADLRIGRELLKGLFEKKLADVLIPPWNRIDDAVIDALPELGFTAVSRFGPEKAFARQGIFFVNSDVDIINWRDGRRGRPADELVSRIAEQIDLTGATERPIGILAHHLAHDETAWMFLESLFELTSEHPAARWLSFEQCLAKARG